MQPVNLAQVADELYTLMPSEFTAARNDRARRARDAGDRELAEAIAGLRRPTVSAWLVNMLTRQQADLVGAALELGESLREAQQAMAGDRLRELSSRRGELIGQLAQQARRLAARAGQRMSAQAEREVMGTFEAALVDPQAAGALRSGWLTSPLSYAGLGAPDVAGAVAEPVSLLEWARSHGRGQAAAGGMAERERAEREPASARQPGRRVAGTGKAASRQAERDAIAARRREREAAEAGQELRAAGEEVRQAQSALAGAERQVSRAREAHRAIQRRIEELQRQLDQSTAQESQALAALRQARQSRDAAARALTASQRRLARAQAKAGRDA